MYNKTDLMSMANALLALVSTAINDAEEIADGYHDLWIAEDEDKEAEREYYRLEAIFNTDVVGALEEVEETLFDITNDGNDETDE